jgi:hypothetical protein
MSSDVDNTKPIEMLTTTAAATKRKVKAFPVELTCITDRDRDKFELALEIDTRKQSKTFQTEFLVAKSVRVTKEDGSEDVIDLSSLIVDHLRILCKNVGISNFGSKNKFECRKAIADFLEYQNKLDSRGLHPTSNAARITSTICRAVNVVFSDEFISEFMTVNDRKSRRDHECATTYQDFWIRAAIAHNSCIVADTSVSHSSSEKQSSNNHDDINSSSSTDSLFVSSEDVDDEDKDPYNSLVIDDEDDVHLAELSSDSQINLSSVVQFDTTSFRKKILNLFKIRRIMQENMTVSGTHDNEPWNFVEVAMSKLPGAGFTKASVYYFFKRCELVPDIDSHFQPFLDPELMGDSTCIGSLTDENDSDTKGTSASSSTLKRTKENLEGLLGDMIDQTQSMLSHLEAAANDRKEALDLTRKKMKFTAQIDLAKALGDQDELKRLMEEAKTLN